METADLAVADPEHGKPTNPAQMKGKGKRHEPRYSNTPLKELRVKSGPSPLVL